MTPQAAKAKGRRLQQWVRDKILLAFPTLADGDVRSTSSGANGVDVLLSPAAAIKFPYDVECKSLAKVAVYKYFDQASSNSDKLTPLVIVKANSRRPLAIVDAEHFIELVKGINNEKGSKQKTGKT